MTVCASLARGAMMRLTRLDECGVPVEGDCSVVTTKGWASVGVEPIYRDADEIEEVNANGELCVNDRSCPQFKWNQLEIVLCNVDPDAWNIITGDEIVLDDATEPETVGFRQSGQFACDSNFALELWSNITGLPCGVGESRPYGYWLFPFVGQAQVGEWTFENAALTLTLTAITKSGSLWDVGPYDVRTDSTGAGAPLLTPIGPNDHMHYEVATAPLPEPACGCTPLPPVVPVEGLSVEPETASVPVG